MSFTLTMVESSHNRSGLGKSEAHRAEKARFVHSLYAMNTIEDRIFTLLRAKREVFREVFGSRPDADDKSLTRLSDEDLFGLFDLEPPNEEDTDTQNSSRG